MARQTSAKGKFILLGVMTLIFGLFILITNLLKDKAHQMGQLRVTSSPGANVFIDNINVGKTPFEKNIEVKEYLVKLIPDRLATATASWEGKVPVHKNARTYINRELGATDILSSGEVFTIPPASSFKGKNNTGEVYIESEPIGALVYLDNEEQGVAPLTLQNVPVGSHELSIFMPGFVRRTIKINVESKRSLRGLVKLALDEIAQRAKREASVEAMRRASESARLAQQEQVEATQSANIPDDIVIIAGTPNGWLRVREKPSLVASEAAIVNEGDRFSVLESVGGWVRIPYDEGKEGWVSAQFVVFE